MGFINNHGRVCTQRRINHKLPQQHTIGHVLNNRILRGIILKPDGIPDLLSQLNFHLLGNSGGNRHGCYSSWLGASNLFISLGVSDLVEVLGKLGGFAGTGLADHDDDLVLVN